MTYPEEVLIQIERDRILNIVDEMIAAENANYDMASTPEMIGICAAIRTLKDVKKLITAV